MNLNLERHLDGVVFLIDVCGTERIFTTTSTAPPSVFFFFFFKVGLRQFCIGFTFQSQDLRLSFILSVL